MRVSRFTLVQRKQKRIVGVVGVEQVEGAEVKDGVAGHGGQEGVQEVVAFVIELRVVNAENLVELGARAVHLR
jgi:hypothetical protein